MAPETFGRVSTVVAAYLRIPIEKIAADAPLDDLGLDSLGSLEIVQELEEDFHIDIPDEKAYAFRTVRAVCDCIESLQAASSTEQ